MSRNQLVHCWRPLYVVIFKGGKNMYIKNYLRRDGNPVAVAFKI